jgi:RNA polymerase sigma-70 factor (ECF subfamily)
LKLQDFPSRSHASPRTGDGVFATTHWTAVLAAADTGSPQSAEALEKLCRAYWYPLYAYVRRKGHDAPEAQDLTQGFFRQLLTKNYLGAADRNKGKFRSFLLGSLEHYLAREWIRVRAQKRGGGQTGFSLDEADAEDRYRMEPVDELSPDRLFDRRWAMTVIEQATTRLREECVASGKGGLFEKLAGLLSGDKGEASYAELASSLAMSEGALKVAVHRLRKRYGELVRAEIAQTVAAEKDVEEELRFLREALRDW